MSTKPTLRDMMISFALKVQQLRDLGVKDIILDPGLASVVNDRTELLYSLRYGEIGELELPILVGNISQVDDIQDAGMYPNESLNGTSVINTISLMKGASILRVHDERSSWGN